MRPLGQASVSLTLSLAILFSGTTPAASQTATLAGTVVNASTGEPLAGAQVFIPGTRLGTLTNAEGHYRLLSVPPGSQRISVLLLGFSQETQAVQVRGGQAAEVNFTLQPTAIALDEIVVTATGERRKVELGNAIAEIQAEEVTEMAPITNAFDLLQGRATGVQVLNTGGGPGISSRIRIRGSNSLSLSNEPIIYMDGIRIESGSWNWMSPGGQDLGRFNDLNPEEIESIEVVKGPSAATLYGTQAANGVIRITTKKGRPGPPRWTAYTEGGIVQDPYTYPDNYLAFDAAGDPCFLASYREGLCQIESVSHYQPLEDERFTIFGTGWRQQYGLSVSGGGDQINYFLSGEWEEEVGPYELKPLYERHLDSLGFKVKDTTKRPQQLQKLSLRGNFSVNLTEKAVLSVNTGWVGSTTNITFNDNTQYSAVRLGYLGGAVRPESNSYDPSIWYAGRGPDVLFAEDFFKDVGRYTVSARLDWSPLSWLEIRGVVGMDQTSLGETDNWPENLFPDSPESGRILVNHQIRQQTVDLGATSSFSLSPSLLSETSVGAQFLRDLRHAFFATGLDLAGGVESVGAGTDRWVGETTTESRTLGVFLEEQLSWNDRLFLTGAVRLDDNSAFGKDFDAIIYPKFSASWHLSQEDWFPSLPGLDQLRLRTAWGWSGLQPEANAAVLSFRPQLVDTEGGVVGGALVDNMGNPDLKPEKSRELEAGFDGDFLDGRLGVEFTYYKKRSEDALVLRTLPPSSGAQSERWENLASIENQGLEAGINAILLNSPGFTWNLNLSGSVNHNKILDFGEGVSAPSEYYREGYPGGSVWDYPIESYSDENGDGMISPEEVVVGEEDKFLGPMIPEQEVSLRTDLTLWRFLRINFLMDYRGGFVIQNVTASIRCRQGYCRADWDPSTPLWEQARTVANTYAGWYEKGDFIKLREAGFTLFAPDEWATRMGMTRLSLTVTGRNLATWSDYTGPDPEVNSYGVGNPGGQSWTNWDWNAQAPFRYWTARINVGF